MFNLSYQISFKSPHAAIVLIASGLSLSACSADDTKTVFVAECSKAVTQNGQALCGCIYDELNEKFNEPQMTLISGFFRSDIPTTMSRLKKVNADPSTDEKVRLDNTDIINRVNTIEQAAEGCFAKAN